MHERGKKLTRGASNPLLGRGKKMIVGRASAAASMNQMDKEAGMPGGKEILSREGGGKRVRGLHPSGRASGGNWETKGQFTSTLGEKNRSPKREPSQRKV